MDDKSSMHKSVQKVSSLIKYGNRVKVDEIETSIENNSRLRKVSIDTFQKPNSKMSSIKNI